MPLFFGRIAILLAPMLARYTLTKLHFGFDVTACKAGISSWTLDVRPHRVHHFWVFQYHLQKMD